VLPICQRYIDKCGEVGRLRAGITMLLAAKPGSAQRG
jgi:hypothetical protein